MLLGLAVNAGSAWIIARSSGGSLNLRGAFLHLVSDAAGSVGVIIAGLVVIITGAEWVDPLISILISVLVLVAAWQLLRDATRVLLEGAPKGLDVAAVEQVAHDRRRASRPSTTCTSGRSGPRRRRSPRTSCSPVS